MPRKSQDVEGTEKKPFDYAAVGGDSIKRGYAAPCTSHPQWKLPTNERLISDLQRCGGNLSLYLEAINPDGDARSRQILLGAILTQLKEDDEESRDWDDIRAAGDSARLLMIQEMAMEKAAAGELTPNVVKLLTTKQQQPPSGGEQDGENAIDGLRKRMQQRGSTSGKRS